MKVSVKDFTINMDIKSNGMELEVRDPDGNFRGDCFVTMTGLIWCEGKTERANGKKVSWNKFIKWMNE